MIAKPSARSVFSYRRAERPERARMVIEIDAELLSRFDQWGASRGYTSRADTLRNLIADALNGTPQAAE